MNVMKKIIWEFWSFPNDSIDFTFTFVTFRLQPTHERHEAIPTKRDRLYEMYDESYDKEERDDELQRKADQYYEELLIS